MNALPLSPYRPKGPYELLILTSTALVRSFKQGRSGAESRGPRRRPSAAQLSIVHPLTYQNLLVCRVPINPILGFVIGTYKKVGFSRSR